MKQEIIIDGITVTKERTGHKNLGRCYNQYNYDIVCTNPTPEQLAKINGLEWHTKLLTQLKEGQVNRLGSFSPDLGRTTPRYVAHFMTQVDSSD